MNTAFVLPGLFTIVGISLPWKSMAGSPLLRVANVIWFVVGAARILVGSNPENLTITAHLVRVDGSDGRVGFDQREPRATSRSSTTRL